MGGLSGRSSAKSRAPGYSQCALWSKCLGELLIWPCVLNGARQMLGWPEAHTYAAFPHKPGEREWPAGQLWLKLTPRVGS